MDNLMHPAVYDQKIQGLQTSIMVDDSRLGGLATQRLIVFFLTVFTALAAWWNLCSYWVLFLPVALFVYLVYLFRKVEASLWFQKQTLSYYQDRFARCEHQLPVKMVDDSHLKIADHAFADDLDIFGPGSLFRRLALAWTPWGSRTLAETLLTLPEKIEAMSQRQEAVKELTPLLDEREHYVAASAGLTKHVELERLKDWATTSKPVFTSLERWLCSLASVAFLGSVILWQLGWLAGYSIGFALLFLLAMAGWLRKKTGEVLENIDKMAGDLRGLTALLAHAEEQKYQSLLLKEIQQVWNKSASISLRQLGFWVERLEYPRNALFLPFTVVLLWTNRCAFAIRDWHQEYGAVFAQWLASWGKLEVFHALAAYAYENPEHIYPEVSQSQMLEAIDLGHPLLPVTECIRNDLALGETQPKLIVVSGSNMAGKSTWLRTIGLNIVLGLNGSPVKAKSMKLSLRYPFAVIRINDSLQSGKSKFYTEILRIRACLQAATNQPILFLLDELLSGTNSIDRLAGAEGVFKGLLERGAIGLATTHDLALTELASRLGTIAQNVHLSESWEGDKIMFDYKLQPGPVMKGNGVALMRAVGIKV